MGKEHDLMNFSLQDLQNWLNYEELPVSMAEVHNRENKATFVPKLS